MKKIEKLKCEAEFTAKNGFILSTESNAEKMIDKINEIIEAVNCMIKEKEDEEYRKWEEYMGGDL